MDQLLRQLIRDRAGNRCEYCRLPQVAVRAILQVEHVIARQHSGSSVEDNLALACDRCNLYKGTNLSAVDPDSGQIVRLFHPRLEDWDDHFALVGAEVVGKTPEGRATARLLRFNVTARIDLRRSIIEAGQW